MVTIEELKSRVVEQIETELKRREPHLPEKHAVAAACKILQDWAESTSSMKRDMIAPTPTIPMEHDLSGLSTEDKNRFEERAGRRHAQQNERALERYERRKASSRASMISILTMNGASEDTASQLYDNL
ncbi:MAG TPA: hypothetical protein VN086_00605 [Candidatus Paceibacterota bacterium]|nr:hypothetical protein [Candidatus Paceibacterota bacterium]